MLKKLVLTLGLAVTLSGCVMVRYESPSLQNQPTADKRVERYMTFFWGIFPGSPVSLEQCGAGGVKSMKVRQNFLDWIISTGTGGIVRTTRVVIYCAEPMPPGMPTVPAPVSPVPADEPLTE